MPTVLRLAFYELLADLFTWLLERTAGRSERIVTRGLELAD